MPRARNIKHGFYTNEDLAECSDKARLIFPGLWMLADRKGRLADRPKRIKAELLPFDNADMDALLRELASRNFIRRYEVEGVRYLQVLTFWKHQSPHYSEKQSVIPAPEGWEEPVHHETKTPGKLPESSAKPKTIKTGSQPPDVLNPDSLNPDSPNSEISGGGNAGTGKPVDNSIRAQSMAALLLTLMVKISAHDPLLMSWAISGVTNQKLSLAVSEAQAARKRDGEDDLPINAKFLDKFVRAKPKRTRITARSSDEQIIAAASMRGVPGPNPGESREAAIQRINGAP